MTDRIAHHHIETNECSSFSDVAEEYNRQSNISKKAFSKSREENWPDDRSRPYVDYGSIQEQISRVV